MKSFRVAVLANLKKNAPHFDGMPEDQWDDLDSEKTVNALVEAIRSGGHEAEFIEGNASLVDTLPKYQPDICFNICEGHFGDSREAQIPSILEMLQIPYTGSKVLALALALDKPMTKRILAWHDLPTPPFQTFERSNEKLHDDLTFPMFVKPSREGTGMGVSRKSIVHNEEELREQVSYTIERYNQVALVENYIEGREVTVGMVGNLVGPVARRLPVNLRAPRIQAGLQFFPPMEVDLKPYHDTDEVYSNRLKVDLADQLTYLCPADLADEVVDELNWLAAAVFRVTGALDVSRVDFRLDANDNFKPYILEINPLPGLSPGISDIVIEAAADGIERTFALNHLGYFLLTHLLLETLQQSQPARIVNVSSMAHIGGRLNLNNLQLKGNFSSWGAYSQSKLANLYFTYELARRLEGSRVTVNALHPGFVNTNFGKSNGGMKKVMMGALQSVFAITPEKGAETSIYLASSPEVEGVSGQYFVNNNAVRSSQISYDQEIARQLWDASLEMTGLNVTV